MNKKISSEADSVFDAIKQTFNSLTRSERIVANVILENYPISGLGSITQLADKTGVSSPTIVRLVKKLGFAGASEFQNSLRQELEAKGTGPIAKHDVWAKKVPESHILNRFAEAVINNIHKSLGQIETENFDACCTLLSDTQSALYIVGGRVTHALADYLYLHMQMIRTGVTFIQPISNFWPHYMLDIKENDVVVIFDVRRYEKSTLKLAEIAHEKSAQIILFTDQWYSPVKKYSHHCFSAKTVVPSAWDSMTEIMLLVEAFIAGVQEFTWTETRKRIENLEDLFDRTRFFQKFS